MSAVVRKVGSLHMSGPKGRKRWRVYYWLEDDPRPISHYIAKAEGNGKINKRDANKLMARWLQHTGLNPGSVYKVRTPTLGEHLEHYLAMVRPRYAESTWVVSS